MASLKIQKVRSIQPTPIPTRTGYVRFTPLNLTQEPNHSGAKHIKNKLSLGSIRQLKSTSLSDSIQAVVSPKNSSLISGLRNIADNRQKSPTSQRLGIDLHFVNSHYQLMREMSPKAIPEPRDYVKYLKSLKETPAVLPRINCPSPKLRTGSPTKLIKDISKMDFLKRKKQQPQVRIELSEDQKLYVPSARQEDSIKKPQLRIENSQEIGSKTYNEHKHYITFSQQQKIRGRPFLIEIAKEKQGEGLYIFGKDIKTTNLYIFKLMNEALEIILPAMNHSYQELANNLDFRNSRLVLGFSVNGNGITKTEESLEDFSPSKWEKTEKDEYESGFEHR